MERENNISSFRKESICWTEPFRGGKSKRKVEKIKVLEKNFRERIVDNQKMGNKKPRNDSP